MEQYNPDPNHPKVTHQESRPKKNDIVTAAILFVTVMTDSVVLTDLNDKEREAWELLKTAVEDPEGERPGLPARRPKNGASAFFLKLPPRAPFYTSESNDAAPAADRHSELRR